MTRQAVRNVFWSGTEAVVSGVLSFASVCVVARLVGPSEFGLGAAVVAVHVLLWVAVNALFADALVQRGDADAETLSTALWASVATGCLAVPLQIAGGWLIAAWLHDPRLLTMSLLLAVPLPLVGAGGAMQGVLTMRRRYRTLAWRTIAGQGLGTATGILAAWMHDGAWAPVLQQFVISAVGAATLLVGAGVRPRVVVRWPIARSLLRVGLPLTASTLVLIGRYRVFAILIGGTAGSTVLGQVHMAFRLVETVRELAFTAQWRLMLPLLAERRPDRAALRRSCDRLLAWSSLAILPLCGAMALAMPALVRLVLGPAWVPSGWAGEPLIALMALLTLTFPAGVAVVARGDTTRPLLASTLSTAATLAGAMLLEPATPLGASLLWLAAHLIAMPYMLWINSRALGTGLFRPLRAGWPLLGVVLVGVLAGLLVPEPGGALGVWLLRGIARTGVFAAIVLPCVGLRLLRMRTAPAVHWPAEAVRHDPA